MQNIINLERLNMSYSALVTDSGVATLVTAKGDQICELNLAGCQRITDASLRLLQTARALKSLDLRKCEGISPEACQRFVKSSRQGSISGGAVGSANGNNSVSNKSPTKKAKARKESNGPLPEIEVWVMLEEKLFEKQKLKPGAI